MTPRRIALPLVALLAAIAVAGANIAAGGADYNADEPADPCVVRDTGTVPPEIDPVAQQVVLAGVDKAACSLGVTRERLILALASPSDQNELVSELGTTKTQLARTLKQGMHDGIADLQKRGEVPKASALLPDIIDQLDLGAAGSLAGAIPDSVIDNVLPTQAVLDRAVDKIDFEQLLSQLTDPDQLEPQLRKAILDAAIEEARARITEQLGSGLGGLFD